MVAFTADLPPFQAGSGGPAHHPSDSSSERVPQIRSSWPAASVAHGGRIIAVTDRKGSLRPSFAAMGSPPYTAGAMRGLRRDLREELGLTGFSVSSCRALQMMMESSTSSR